MIIGEFFLTQILLNSHIDSAIHSDLFTCYHCSPQVTLFQLQTLLPPPPLQLLPLINHTNGLQSDSFAICVFLFGNPSPSMVSKSFTYQSTLSTPSLNPNLKCGCTSGQDSPPPLAKFTPVCGQPFVWEQVPSPYPQLCYTVPPLHLTQTPSHHSILTMNPLSESLLIRIHPSLSCQLIHLTIITQRFIMLI